MIFFKYLKLRFKHMLSLAKSIEVDSKFLILTFFICLIPICIASFTSELNSHGNLITIRTMFSSVLGYIIENISAIDKKNKPPKEDIIKQIETNIKSDIEADNNQEISSVPLKSPKQKTLQQKDIRILIMGHVLIFLTLCIIIGAITNVDQNNQSLILLKNTAFASIGFLISSTKNKRI